MDEPDPQPAGLPAPGLAKRASAPDAAALGGHGSPRPESARGPAFHVLGAISFSHFVNDMMQSLLLAIYPLLKSEFRLGFAQIGLITLTYQLTGSLLQPLVGYHTDRHPRPYSLAFGMGCTFAGLVTLSLAGSYPFVLLAAALVGTGSSVFHPESSRVARLASGGRPGLAQSIFQVGGNSGAAAAPLVAAWLILPHGRRAVAWVAAVTFVAIAVLAGVGRWYAHRQRLPRRAGAVAAPGLPNARVRLTLAVLGALMFSKFVYLASLNSYLTFYLMHRFGIGPRVAQMHLFYFLFAVAAGTLLGGPIGDRIGRRRVIWVSILGIAPFTLALPYVGLTASAGLTMIIGFTLASAFPAMLVYAQELIPNRVGTISGLFYGLAFGLGGLGAAALGQIADHWGITAVYRLCSFLPLIGLLAVFLPDLRPRPGAGPGAPAAAASPPASGDPPRRA